MNILLYSYVFAPRVGGVETVSRSLAEGFIRHGYKCKVITETPEASTNLTYKYDVIRKPDAAQRKQLVSWADVIVFNGASLALQPQILLQRKPFVWIHVGYQASCIDGLGWVEGEKAPLAPMASFNYHFRRFGWKAAIAGGLKLFLRRFAATYLVTCNVAITDWVKHRQPFPRQVRIYNPFPLESFIQDSSNKDKLQYDFLFVGRLVSEKGVDTLLDAFSILVTAGRKDLTLLIIGDGNWRTKLENLAGTLGIKNQVYFTGQKAGQELVDLIYQAPIAIVPSQWEEPMGGVALELLAAGRNIIVSKNGGLAECIGEAGLTFNNGDAEALAKAMLRLHEDKHLQEMHLLKAQEQIIKFNPEELIQQYRQLLNKIVSHLNQ